MFKIVTNLGNTAIYLLGVLAICGFADGFFESLKEKRKTEMTDDYVPQNTKTD